MLSILAADFFQVSVEDTRFAWFEVLLAAIMISVVFVVRLTVQIAKIKQTTAAASEPEKRTQPKRSLKSAVTAALLLYVFDGWAAGQGGLALLFLLGLGPWVLFGLVKQSERPWFVLRLKKAAIVAAGAIAVFPTIRWHAYHAHTEAERVIAAVKAYQAKNSEFPQGLDHLIPEFLPAIPQAKWTFMWGDFSYTGPNEHTAIPFLYYYALPPYGRRIYHFDERGWKVLD